MALALEEPVSLLLPLPGVCIIHGVHVADEGNVGYLPHRDILGGHDHKLSALEHYRRVGYTGVIKYATKEVQADTKWLPRCLPKIKKVSISGMSLPEMRLLLFSRFIVLYRTFKL